MPNDSNGVFKSPSGASLGDWLKSNPAIPPGSTIDLRPIEVIGDEAPPAFGIPFPDIGLGGIIGDASDPFGLRRAGNTFAGAFGKSFGSMAGLAVLLGVGYIIFKSETRTSRKSISRRKRD